MNYRISGGVTEMVRKTQIQYYTSQIQGKYND